MSFENFQERCKEELLKLESSGLLRKQRCIKRLQFPYIEVEGNKLLDFSSNNYLGLADNQDFLDAVQEKCRGLCVGATGSRLLTGHSSINSELEKKIADWKGFESALLFPSGYQANLGTIAAVAQPGDTVYLDKLCHASIIDGAKLSGARVRVFKHKDYSELKDKLQKQSGGNKVVVTDGVFSMDGDAADLTILCELRKDFGFALLVDDAHGTGVTGEGGRGTISAQKIKTNEIDILTGTLSKALAGQGGFVCAGKSVTDLLINKSRSFIYSTGISPWLAAAGLLALDFIRTTGVQKELEKRIDYLKMKLPGIKPDHPSAICPIMIGDEKKALDVSLEMQKKGFFLPAIRYPTVKKDEARLRISLSAAHTTDHIDNLLETLSGLVDLRQA